MKLRLPSLLRRLLIAATTVTSVTIGSSNSYGAITNSDVSQSTYTDFGQDTGRYRTEADDDALLTRISELLSDDTADSTDGQESYTLGGLSLDGDFIEQADAALAAETDSAPALNITDAVQSDALTVLQAGGVPTEAGDTVANVNAGGVDVAAQESAAQTFALARTTSETSEQLSSGDTTEDELYLALSETADSNIWAGDADNNTWSSTQFSVYGTSQVVAEGMASFDTTAANKSVNVSGAVSVGGMSISGGGYSFGGAGSIALSGQLSVSGGGASTIDQIEIPTESGPIAVDGSELTIVQLTPTNPFAPIALSNGAKLTIGNADHRYGAFSGQVTATDAAGGPTSQLHLYTTQVDDNYWGTDGTVRLSADSTVQDVYIHGDLALNIIASKQGSLGDLKTTVQGANLHMDANSRLVVRADEGADDPLVPTKGDIVMYGDLNIVAYQAVTTNTAISSDFVLAQGATGTLIKEQTTNANGSDATGSITLSGGINVSGITVQAGTLKLTGSSITAPTLSVSGGSLVVANAAGSLSATSGLSLAAGTSANITANTITFGAGDNSISMASGATATINGQTVTTGHLEILNGASLTLAGGAYTFNGKMGANNNANSQIIFQGTSFATDTGGRNLNGNFRLESDAALTGGYVHVTSGATLQVNAGKTLHLSGGDLELQNNANLVLQSDSKIIIGSGRTMKAVGNVGTEGVDSTITLAGGTLELNLAGDTSNPTYQTVYSDIVVNNTAATAEALSTSIIKNNSSGESMHRTLSSVSIAANNTLELQQNNWNTIWNINDLSGAGNLLWTSGTNHWTPSRLVLSGDGSDFTGNIKLNRTGGAQDSRKYQIYMEVADNDAVKGATLDLVGKATNNVVSLAINADAVTMQGLKGNEHTHLYAGASPTYVGSSDADSTKINAAFASTANNTLTLAGGDTYEFKGTVGTANETAHLNLAMIGEGTQTFSGVANVGDVSVSAGKLALSNASSKVYGNIAVSGGALDFDGTYTLGAGQSLSISTATSGAASLAALVLAGGEIIFDATALSADTAALSVGTLSLGQGTTSQTISLSHATALTSGGRYLLATGDWAAAAADDFFTISGLRYGSTAAVVCQDGHLYLDYTQSANTIYVWNANGTSTDWNYADDNWDTTPDDADGQTPFAQGGSAVFNTTAHVTVSEAVTVTDLMVQNQAHLTLTETAALTASSIFVDAGSTLTFATAKNGLTANITGEGIVEVALTKGASNNYNNALKLGADFAGETHVTSGWFTITGAQVGNKLVLADAVEMQTSANGTIVTADVELLGSVKVHANSNKNITYNGSVTGATSGVYLSAGSSSHTFNGSVDLQEYNIEDVATVTFNGDTSLGSYINDFVNGKSQSATVNFDGTTEITTATISKGTTNIGANAEATITTANLSGGTLNVNGQADITTLAVDSGSATVGGTGQLDITTTTVSGGTLNMNTAQAELGAVSVSGGSLNINSSTSAALDSLTMSGSGAVSFASAGTTVGDITLSHQASLTFGLAANMAATSYTVGAMSMSDYNSDQRSCSGTITIDSGVTVNATSLTNNWGLSSLTVNGALNVSGALTYSTGDGEQNITGTGKITAGSATFSNLGTYVISVDEMEITGSLTLRSTWGGTSYSKLTAGVVTVKGAVVDGGDTHNMTINGGTLQLQGGGAFADGELVLQSGALRQQGGNTTISTSTFDISGGELAVEGGRLTLSALNNVTGGTVTLSGGTLDVTKEIAAKLMNSTASFTMSGGVLDLADQSFTAGTAADAIALTHTAGLTLNSGTLALGALTTGTYYLFSSGAEDVWDAFSAANVTINGENALRYGATLGYTEADGVTYATLTTTSDAAGNLTLYWDGGESGSWDGTLANWNMLETLDGDNVDFNNADSVVFNTNATVNATEALQAGSLTVNADATVSLSGSLSADSIVVDSGKLSLSGSGISASSYSVAAGAELERVATGTDTLATTILCDATGAGDIIISGAGKDNTTVKLANGAESQATGKLTLSNLTLDMKETDSGSNADTYDLSSYTSMAWDGVNVLYHGTNTTFNNVTVGSNGADVAIQDMNTKNALMTFAGTTTLDGDLSISSNQWKYHIKIELLTGTGDLSIASPTDTTGYSDDVKVTIDAVNQYTGDVIISQPGVKKPTLVLNAANFGTNDSTITMTGGILELNLEAHSTNPTYQTVYSNIVVDNEAATAEDPSTSIIKNNSSGESMHRTLSSVSIAANNTLELQQNNWNTIWIINDLSGEGNLTWNSRTSHNSTSRLVLSGNNEFSGTIKLNRNNVSDVNASWHPGDYQSFVVLTEENAAKNATLELSGQTAKMMANLVVDTENARIAGLNSSLVDGSRNQYAHVYAGAVQERSSSTAASSTANNTLTIAGGKEYTFAGTVGTANESAHLNLAMIGSGSQTFSGVAHVGDVSVSDGALVLSNEASVVNGDITVSGGSFTLGSSYTLGEGQVLSVLTGAENAVTLGGIELAGGEMVFNTSLLNANTAALTLTAAATVGEGGSATVTLDFAGGVLADGTYKLAGGDWSAAAGGSIFTLNGLNYGSGTVSANADGLWLTYTAASNVYIWTGGAAGTWDETSANWDNTPGTENDSTSFVNSTADADTHAVFDGGEAMSLSIGSAISVNTLSVINGANVTLTRPKDDADASLTVEHLVIANGRLTLGADGTQESNWTGIKDITIKQDGMLDFFYGNGLSSETLTPILLQGGTLNLRNGAGTHTVLNAAISVDDYGTIGGSRYGGNTVLSGTISGHGELHFSKDLVNSYTNPITVSSTISDDVEGALALYVDSTEVKLTGANTYTGGTTIGTDGMLTITNAQALGASSADNVLGKVSGAGTLVLELGSSDTVAYATGKGAVAVMGGFTGTVDVTSGWLVVGNSNSSGTGAEADFGAKKVIVRDGGIFSTHFGQGMIDDNTNTDFASAIDLMSGGILKNIDGSTEYTGTIRFNVKDDNTFASDGTVKIQQYWQKKMTFSGLLEGDGIVELSHPSSQDKAIYIINGDSNTFAGTYKLVGTTQDKTVELHLGSQTAAQYADINLASTTTKSYLMLDSDATINGLYGGNAVQAQGDAGVTRTLTVSEGNYSGILCNYSPEGEAARVLALTKQGDGTLTLTGANSYTGATKVTAGTLELAGAVSMNAASDISVAADATLLLNATNSAAMTLGNDITSTGTIHKKGTYETVLSGDVTATLITVKDHQVDDKTAQNKTDAGTLTLTGSTVKADTLYAAYGTVNVGGGTSSTFMQVGRIEAGDSASTDGNATLNVKSGSTLTVTGSNNTEGYKDASLLLGEWEHGTNLNVAGTLLAPNAKAMVGDNVANITIENGGVMAVNGISVADTTDKASQTQEIKVTLNDGGTLILGDAGITTYKTFTGKLGAGTVGMSAGSTTIAEDVTLTSAEGTTFDTTQYGYVTNTDNVATGIERGTKGGEMTISGNISSADNVEAKMKVAGAGSLTVSGAANTLSGGLEVEKDATLKLNTVASVTSQNSTEAATMTGAVSITTAEGITKLAGTGDKPATMDNSLVTIAQGASLTVENMMVSSTSRIIGEAVAEATYAMRSTAALSALKTANTTVELTNTNADITGEGENITMQTRDISLKQTGAENSLTLNNAKVLTVTSDALSNLSIAAGSSLHINLDYDALFASIEGGLTDIDLLALSFENVSFADWTTTTITGTTGGYQLTAYYETVENAAANATTVFFDVQAVPEPTTTTLSLLALAALVARRRRK